MGDHLDIIKQAGLPVHDVRWWTEFPIAAAKVDKPEGYRGGGGPYRIDAISPELQIAVECKTEARYLREGKRQMTYYMEQLYKRRNIAGDWDALVTDGNTVWHSRWTVGIQVTDWKKISNWEIMMIKKMPQYHSDEEWEWMRLGVNLYYKNGLQGIECSRCKRWKHVTEYNRNRHRRSGYCNECRHPCYEQSKTLSNKGT